MRRETLGELQTDERWIGDSDGPEVAERASSPELHQPPHLGPLMWALRSGRVPCACLVLAIALITGCGVFESSSQRGGSHRHGTPPWQQASPWPDRIVVTLTQDPSREIAVSWRTDASVQSGEAQIARATPDARFDVGAQSVAASTQPLTLEQLKTTRSHFSIKDNAGLQPVHYHSVTFEQLEPDTLYVYRVGSDAAGWSEWFQVRTAPVTGPISFVYFGDAQNGVHSHWARVVRAAALSEPEARFFLHAGDLVNHASRDYEWAAWFDSVGFIHGMIPAVPVAGNHEYFRVGIKDGVAQKLLSIMWRPQFVLPVDRSLPEELWETVYDIRYTDDLHLFVLNTQGGWIDEQAAWLDAKLAASTARWQVVSFHHPIFSSGSGRDSPEQREALLPVLIDHDVELVLQGHDHTYARGATPAPAGSLERFTEVDPATASVGTVFVNSVSGAKQYEWRENDWEDYASTEVSLARKAENTQLFQIIRIDGDRLEFEAFTADGQLYDAFALRKAADGQRLLVEDPRPLPPERRFANTAPYTGVDDLED